MGELLEAWAAALGAAGVVLLRLAWGRKTGNRGYLIAGGWLLVTSALYFWGNNGGDRGVAIGVAAIIAIAFAVLAIRAQSAFAQRQKKPARTPAATQNQDRRKIGATVGVYTKRVSTFLLAAPLGGAVALLASLSIYKLLKSTNAHEADAITLVFFLAPLLWAAIAAYAVIDKRMLRKAPVIFGAAALSAVHLSMIG